MSLKTIRNFSIIAHVDHGKSTIADRFIQFCEGLTDREMKEQVLDSLDIERARGITIKAQSVTLNYRAQDGIEYQLNFIDTPGHADFSYEVSRSLASCEGALLVVDAASGVQAQTLANCNTAKKENLVIVPVVNKIDLPTADVARVTKQMEDLVAVETDNLITCSGKTGLGIQNVLEAVVRHIPSPSGLPEGPLRARIIDSWFDDYLGVVSLIRIYDGQMSVGDKIKIMSTGKVHKIDALGIFTPKRKKKDSLGSGEVGFLVTGVKDIYASPVGDTIVSYNDFFTTPMEGFKVISPQIYAGMFPIDADDFENFRKALHKLSLNDASFKFQPEVSHSLGHGFRCGFLGTLHMEVVQERLEDEYGLNLISSAPTVTYLINNTKGESSYINNPQDFPPKHHISSVLEPRSRVEIIIPIENMGPVIALCCQEKRGIQMSLNYSGNQVTMVYDMPMIEVICGFADRLKSITHGYGSFDYQFCEYREANVLILDILLNDERVDALAQIVHADQAVYLGKQLVEKLSLIIPRGMFEIKIQAAIGSKILSRSTIKPFRKDVTAKCYGGDPTRKRKLLEKQKKGKKKMKNIGSVTIPQSAFFALMR